MVAAFAAAIALWMGGALPGSQHSPLTVPSASPWPSGTVLSSTVQYPRTEGSEIGPAEMSPLPTPAPETSEVAPPSPWTGRLALSWVVLGVALALGIAFTALRWYGRIAR
jgi:hypothetical protein